MKGKFITFEGAEGSGKSTQVRRICRYLEKRKVPVVLIREPGGVKISEAVRRMLLDVNNEAMASECETLLYMAARAQLVAEVLEPALRAGKVVLCDRFLDSTLVYQGYGNGVDRDLIRTVGRFATRGLVPDLTMVFDIDPQKGLERTAPVKDRIERRPLAYHKRVRRGYRELARTQPRRVRLIRADGSKDAVYEKVRSLVDACLGL